MTSPKVYNEYSKLAEVTICRPAGLLDGVEPIDDVHRHFVEKDPPKINLIMPQYDFWLSLLRNAGIRINELPMHPDLPFQIYTRDVGFVIGERLFLANLREPVRQGETKVFVDWLDKQGIAYERLSKGIIEGGDVLVDFPYVYVGAGQRTDETGLNELQKKLGSDWEVVPVHLASGILHIDCALSIPARDTLVWCPEAITDQHQLFVERFPNLIEVSRSDVLHLAPNMLAIKEGEVCVGSLSTSLQANLRNAGITVHSVDWTEVKKFGGMFRCSSLPMHRE